MFQTEHFLLYLSKLSSLFLKLERKTYVFAHDVRRYRKPDSLSLLSIKAMIDLGNKESCMIACIFWLVMLFLYFSAFHRCKNENNKILNVKTGCILPLYFHVWEHFYEMFLAVVFLIQPMLEWPVMCRVPIFREGKMDIKMLDELLPPLPPPPHPLAVRSRTDESANYFLILTDVIVYH